MIKPKKDLLTEFEIQERLIKFNQTLDWSIFDDIPASQEIYIKSPFMSAPMLSEKIHEHEDQRKMFVK